VVDNYGQNALLNSIYSKQEIVFRKLLQWLPITSTDSEHNSCAHIAAAVGSVEILRICIEECGLRPSVNVFNQSALHLASTPEVIEYLILQDYDVQLQDREGWSVLHHAAYRDLQDCVRVLLQIGANAELVNKEGKNALEIARETAPASAALIQKEMDRNIISQSAPVLGRPASVELGGIKENSSGSQKKANGKEKNGHKVMLSPEAEDEILEVASEEENEPSHTPLVQSGLLKRNPSTDSLQSQITPKIKVLISEMILKTPSDKISLSAFGVDLARFDELKLREVLGQGAYGTVYRGYFRDSEVAIKVIKSEKLDDRLAKEFIKEIDSLIRIRHSRFLALLGVCIEGPLCIVTELSKGGNLASAVEQQRLSKAEKLTVALQIAEGITYIHSKSPPIVHRDLKPQNILLDEHKQVKIGDLGLSRAIEKVANSEQIDSTRVCAGTLNYMAPELYEEDPKCTRATDVYAFGCVILHLFAGAPPWHGLLPIAIQRKLIFKEPFAIPDGLEEDLAKLVRSCCEMEPGKRASFREIRNRLMEMLGIQASQQT
jgi:tRNA A-37 threonylcarbamoyl transferase component Bud32